MRVKLEEDPAVLLLTLREDAEEDAPATAESEESSAAQPVAANQDVDENDEEEEITNTGSKDIEYKRGQFPSIINDKAESLDGDITEKAIKKAMDLEQRYQNSDLQSVLNLTKAGIKSSKNWRTSTTLNTFKNRLSSVVLKNLNIQNIPYVFMKNLEINKSLNLKKKKIPLVQKGRIHFK